MNLITGHPDTGKEELYPKVLEIIRLIKREAEKQAPLFFTVNQFSNLTGILPITIKSWCRRKILKAFQPKGADPKMWIICRSNLDDWKRQCEANNTGGTTHV